MYLNMYSLYIILIIIIITIIIHVYTKKNDIVTSIDRPFVQGEIQWAKKYNKKIITIVENDKWRPCYFDFNRAKQKYKNTEFNFLFDIEPIEYKRESGEARHMVNMILSRAHGAPNIIPFTNSLNDIHTWDFFLSHHQVMGGDQTKTLHLLLENLGKSTWYDKSMVDRRDHAQEEGVHNSKYFILFLTGTPPIYDQ